MGQRPAKQAEINEYRRRSMIDGTLRSLSEKGVAGTTVRSICGGEAGSRGLIAHYYASKEDLIAAAFVDLMQTITTAVRQAQSRCGNDKIRQLKTLPRVMFSADVFTEINRGAFLTFWHEIRFNTAVREANKHTYRDYSRDVTALFEEAARQTGVDIDASSAALGLTAMVDGLWLELSINERAISRKKAVALCCNYIDQQLKIYAPITS